MAGGHQWHDIHTEFHECRSVSIIMTFAAEYGSWQPEPQKLIKLAYNFVQYRGSVSHFRATLPGDQSRQKYLLIGNVQITKASRVKV
jgi:hypothetical protein